MGILAHHARSGGGSEAIAAISPASARSTSRLIGRTTADPSSSAVKGASPMPHTIDPEPPSDHAAPTSGWPANGSSVAGVKMRTGRGSPASMKIVSE